MEMEVMEVDCREGVEEWLAACPASLISMWGPVMIDWRMAPHLNVELS